MPREEHDPHRLVVSPMRKPEWRTPSVASHRATAAWRSRRASRFSQSVSRLADAKGLVERTYERGPRQPVLRLTELGARVGAEIAQVFQAVPVNVGECFGGDLAQIEDMRGRFERFSGLLTDRAENIRPSSARVYDYLIGGWHHSVADREGARALLAVLPEARGASLANRAFLRRAVRYLCQERGVRQFIDVGAGLPTTGSTQTSAETPEAAGVRRISSP